MNCAVLCLYKQMCSRNSLQAYSTLLDISQCCTFQSVYTIPVPWVIDDNRLIFILCQFYLVLILEYHLLFNGTHSISGLCLPNRGAKINSWGNRGNCTKNSTHGAFCINTYVRQFPWGFWLISRNIFFFVWEYILSKLVRRNRNIVMI